MFGVCDSEELKSDIEGAFSWIELDVELTEEEELRPCIAPPAPDSPKSPQEYHYEPVEFDPAPEEATQAAYSNPISISGENSVAGSELEIRYERCRVLKICWGCIPLLICLVGLSWVLIKLFMPTVETEQSPILPSNHWGATQHFQATETVFHWQATPSQSPMPDRTEEVFNLPCIDECLHLNDRELIIEAILSHCQIQEWNSRDCAQMLWCLACNG
jgi:hypothetical protein